MIRECRFCHENYVAQSGVCLSCGKIQNDDLKPDEEGAPAAAPPCNHVSGSCVMTCECGHKCEEHNRQGQCEMFRCECEGFTE